MSVLSSGEYKRVQTAEMAAIGLRARYDQFDKAVTGLLARHGITLLRVSIGIVYIWFGALKAFHGVSPIEDFIRETINFLPGDLFLPFLALWEVAIGIGFIVWKFPRLTLILMLMQMGGAMSPMILRPDLVWQVFPYQFTLVGQYIFKDIILVSAALVIGATARGGGLTNSAKTLKRSRGE
ncbi:MAG: hypothetical protein K8I30_23630 [Anaerolineae bacterium]|nr:hypothetical protein [Anaerolineae bacterium]